MKWPCVSIPSLYGFNLGYWQPGPPQPPAQPPPRHLLAPEPPQPKWSSHPGPPQVVMKTEDPAVAEIDPLVAAVLAQSAVPMGARK